MADSLSYLSLRCVFEYLEANKRLHIASRSTALRNLEKSIPLHLDHLKINEKEIRINNLTYELHKYNKYTRQEPPESEQLTPGDIQFDPENATWAYERFRLQICNENHDESWKRLPRRFTKEHVARKVLAGALLGGRPTIHVDGLVVSTFRPGAIIRLPEELKIQPRNIDTGHNDPRIILSILHAPGNLRLANPSLELVNCPAAKSAINFEMVSFQEKAHPTWLLEYAKTLNNRNVLLESYDIRNEELIEIVEYWIENPKEIGTILRIDNSRNDMGYEYCLEGIRGKFEKREKNNTPYYSIPINSTSQLLLYKIPRLFGLIFIMEVAPIDGSPCFVKPETQQKTTDNRKLTTENLSDDSSNSDSEEESGYYDIQEIHTEDLIHITSRSPSLQKFEKSVPFHLEYLKLQPNVLQINHLHFDIISTRESIYSEDPRFKYRPDSESLTPGDIHFYKVMENRWNASLPVLRIQINYDPVHRGRVPLKYKEHEALKILTTRFLGGRREIIVNNLQISSMNGYHEDILRLPVGLKLTPRNLIVWNFSQFLPILKLSEPLRSLQISDVNPELLRHKVSKSAKLLKFSRGLRQEDYTRLLPFLKAPTHQNVFVEEFPFEPEEIFRIVESWKENEQEVGTILRISFDKETGFLYWKATRERFAHSTITNPLIRINSTSVILIYNETNLRETIIALEVFPSQKSTQDQSNAENDNFGHYVCFCVVIVAIAVCCLNMYWKII